MIFVDKNDAAITLFHTVVGQLYHTLGFAAAFMTD
jgi:hypothetical protein